MIIGAGWLLIIAMWAYGPEDRSSTDAPTQTTARPTPPSLPIDKSAKMQASRQEFIDKMIAQRIFSEVKFSEGNRPYVHVMPTFLEGDNIQDKATIISVVYAFCYDGTNDRDFVQLLDSQTGKRVGTYSLVQGGLKMD